MYCLDAQTIEAQLVPKTAKAHNFVGNRSTMLKLSGIIRPFIDQKMGKLFFSTNVVFWPILANFWNFLKKMVENVRKKFHNLAKISAIFDKIWGGFFPRSLWDPIDHQKFFWCSKKISAFFWHFSQNSLFHFMVFLKVNRNSGRSTVAEISVRATWVHPDPKYFSPHQVMTLDYSPNEYFSLTQRTREDILFQSLPLLNVDFWFRKAHNSILSCGLFCTRNPHSEMANFETAYIREFFELSPNIYWVIRMHMGSLLGAGRKKLGWGAPTWHRQKFRPKFVKMAIFGPKCKTHKCAVWVHIPHPKISLRKLCCFTFKIAYKFRVTFWHIYFDPDWNCSENAHSRGPSIIYVWYQLQKIRPTFPDLSKFLYLFFGPNFWGVLYEFDFS